MYRVVDMGELLNALGVQQSLAIVGGQWGDESKGSVVGLAAPHFDMAVRYSGGHNAGHSVPVGKKIYSAHLLPSALFKGGQACLGAGVIIDPRKLCERELPAVYEAGASLDQLKIDGHAHVVLPHHLVAEIIDERRRGKNAIGSTLSGMGTTTAAKAMRNGVRVNDLYSPNLPGLLSALSDVMYIENPHEVEAVIEGLDSARFSDDDKEWLLLAVTGTNVAIAEQLKTYADTIRPCVADVGSLVRSDLASGKRILFEGAQGNMLDLSHGAYPYVTSSHPGAVGVPAGSGLTPGDLEHTIVVGRFFMSKVGAGGFPSALVDNARLAELNYSRDDCHGAFDEQLTELRSLQGQGARANIEDLDRVVRDLIGNYGTTTGRPRMNGWFDALVTGYGLQMNGSQTGRASFFLSLLDVANLLPEPLVVTQYEYDGPDRMASGHQFTKGDRVTHENFVPDDVILRECHPAQFETLPRLEDADLEALRSGELTDRVQTFLGRIEEHVGAQLAGIRFGPNEDDALLIRR